MIKATQKVMLIAWLLEQVLAVLDFIDALNPSSGSKKSEWCLQVLIQS